MNLAAYLMKPVVSLEDRQPEKLVYVARSHELSGTNQNRHLESLRRYREAMGDGWKTTAEITEAICQWNVRNGFRRIQDAFPTLNKWAKDGIIEMREKEDQNWGRRARLEWRWKK